jgi:DNA-binding response OmpR family regulator
MDGVEFMRRYRQTAAPHAPVVLVTAADALNDVAAGLGADAVLPKPFDLSELLDTLRPYLECLSGR